MLKQYKKTKLTKHGHHRTYQVLKLRSEDGLNFYTITKKDQEDILGKTLSLEIWPKEISFYKYISTFFAYSKILDISNANDTFSYIDKYIKNSHKDINATHIYQALYTAKALPKELQEKFSYLGISHLVAISGFHLGVLSAIIFFILKYPYIYLQQRYFPYRNYHIDIFLIVSFILGLYTILLDYPPSLLRAYVMLIVGFILYDRGYKLISMQTLFVSVAVAVAITPSLLFTLGFYLSVAGVFYIFLFLIHFKHLSKVIQFILIPFWVYLMMLPITLSIFHNFCILHPLSILWSSLFSIFYPLSILLHTINIGDRMDFILKYLLQLDIDMYKLKFDMVFVYIEIILSIISIYKRSILKLLLLYLFGIFIYFIYDITKFYPI